MTHCRSILLGLLALSTVVHSDEPAASKPSLDEVKKASEIMFRSDCARESLRGSEAQRIIQAAIDHVTPDEYKLFYRNGGNWTPEELEKIYAEHPALYWYDAAFEKVLNEVKLITLAKLMNLREYIYILKN